MRISSCIVIDCCRVTCTGGGRLGAQALLLQGPIQQLPPCCHHLSSDQRALAQVSRDLLAKTAPILQDFLRRFLAFIHGLIVHLLPEA